MIGQKLELIINKAIKRANSLSHEYLTLEGIFLALLEDVQVVKTLKACGADLSELKGNLEKFLENAENFSILSEEQILALGKRQFVDEDLKAMAEISGIRYQPEISMALQRVIQRAAMHVQSSGKNKIKGINLLVAMFQEKESYALYLIKKQGIGRLDVVQAIAHDIDSPANKSEEQENIEEKYYRQLDEDINKEGLESTERISNDPLDLYATNLNQLARENQIDPLIGREHEINRIIQILCRRKKNNPLLAGDAGVGKTALIEGLARLIEEEKISPVLSNAQIYSLNLAAILAGAKYRGDFEQRLKLILGELSKKIDKGEQSIIFIDEIHTIMGAGSTAGSNMDASNILKPYLGSGKIKCIGSTTHEEYRKFVEKDSAFSRRFQKIVIDEPSIEDTYKILRGLKGQFEDFHKVKFSNSVLKAAVDLSSKHISDRFLPDKAIDIIDEAGAATKVMSGGKKKVNITLNDIEVIVADLAKIPKKSVSSDEKKKLKNLPKNLKMLIFGQNEAIEKVCDAIMMSRSGLREDDKPMANFIFAGPTGVGKTELAKQLALQLGNKFQRFDMSEYMEKHSVSKLIGAPPGYIGHDQGGILTDAIKKSPYSVLLLDEIEKAHADIFNILLQIMDHGILTDSQGRTTSFKNIILIMTTNAGARELESGQIGFFDSQNSSTKGDKVIKSFFTPEFRNRLDGIIQFRNLDKGHILNIVDKFLYQLQLRLNDKKVEIVFEDNVKEWLCEKGFDSKMGARPIERLIADSIARPLSRKILFEDLSKSGKITIKLVDGTIQLED